MKPTVTDPRSVPASPATVHRGAPPAPASAACPRARSAHQPRAAPRVARALRGAALLVSLGAAPPAWAQAEAAPAGAPQSAPPQAAADPDRAAQSAPPQAEAAPEGAIPGAPPSRLRGERPRPEPRVRVSADARFSMLLGESREVAPPLGWGFGLQLSASLLPLRALRLGFVVDYQQDRFTRTYPQRPEVAQQLLHNTFAFQALLDLPSRWLRPYIAAGAGGSVGRHQPPSSDEGEQTALVPLFRFSAGLGVSPLRWLELTLGTDVSITVSEQRGGVQVDSTGRLVNANGSLFAPGWWSLSLAAGYRFY